MADTIHWGILGAGRIARKFAACLRLVPEARLQAVGSQDARRAEALGEEFAVPARYASYEALAADRSVDVVYIATRHPYHADNIRLCLSAGKAVLCEKPFTINATEAQAAIQLARERRLFLMEAMWTRFFPAMGRVREWLAQGRIGEPKLLQADFGFRNDWRPEGRHLNLALGGGALLDVGVYLVSLSSMCFGSPVNLTSDVQFGETGVDEQCGLILRHARGELSVLAAAIRTETRKEALLYGSDGRIDIRAPFWKPNHVTLTQSDGRNEEAVMPYESFGYQFEIAHVHDCLRQGRTESPIMPLDETLSVMRTLDAIRAAWGLVYPSEAGAPSTASGLRAQKR